MSGKLPLEAVVLHDENTCEEKAVKLLLRGLDYPEGEERPQDMAKAFTHAHLERDYP